MSDNGGPDIARIVSLIMENPKLIEEISAMVKREEGAAAAESPAVEAREEAPHVEEVREASVPPRPGVAGRRGELLSALKPYLSTERARAIDSMMTIADILDAMRAR